MRSRGGLVLASALLAASCGGGSTGVGSVGAVFGRDNDSHLLYVREVPPDLGADKAGLLPGDQVVMIEGRYVRDLTEKEIRTELRGEVGSPILLTILRGNEVLHVKVTRTALRAREPVQPREQKIAE